MCDTESNDGSIDLGALPSYLGYQVRQAQTAVFKDFARIMSEVGVSPGEFSLLTLVEANPAISQTTLALTCGLDADGEVPAASHLGDHQLILLRQLVDLMQQILDLGREDVDSGKVEHRERLLAYAGADRLYAPGLRTRWRDAFRPTDVVAVHGEGWAVDGCCPFDGVPQQGHTFRESRCHRRGA